MIIEATIGNKILRQRFWGVKHFPEKRTPKGLAAAQKIDGPHIDAAIDYALEHAQMLADNFEESENVQRGYYTASICLLGKQRYIGTTTTPQAAARLYDSALFHLWGFAVRPKFRFNYFRLGETFPPLSEEVKKLRVKLIRLVHELGGDPSFLDFSFLQRAEKENAPQRRELISTL